MPVETTGQFRSRADRPLGDYCPIDRAMQLVGNRTSMLLLREAFYGATRFDGLAARVGITDAVAAKRLKELVEAGVLHRAPYQEPGQRTRHEYLLTDSGHALLPALLALLGWGNEYVAAGEWSDVVVEHRECGEEVRLDVRCAAGHDVPEDELRVVSSRLR